MGYYIVSRIEIINSGYSDTPIGYVTSIDDLNTINSVHHYDDFMSWVMENDASLQSGDTIVSVFFETYPVIYGGDWYTTTLAGMNLSEITDLNNPEG